ncbi:MAG TPA: cytochrome c oxidase accessory protein CcoG [Chthoniobacter sp.]|nr:cytochrome c oxidase accessory protein CcoG [Chthoniobacter sp.]
MTATPLKPSLESVATINDDGSRRFIHSAAVSGRFTRWRAILAVLLTMLYVALPWIPINGHPALFLDVAHRQFHYFGLTFVGQDVWVVFFVLSGLGFCLFYVTALLGRVWCGWACPQTVLLDFARRIERWCEGDAPARRALDRSPATLAKIVRRSAKHLLYILFTLLLAHVLLSYFVSLPGLYALMTHSPGENWSAFVFVFLIAAALWFDLAWFREQFCIVLCPYGRLQSALIDNDSLVVGYDEKRGEPRGRKGTAGAGACVDCLRCVQVCPTGIDIRQGLQMECIGCAACIDACDTVMDKLERPRGLVRYDSRHGFEGQPTRWLRPRILLYTGLALLGAAALTYATSTLQNASVGLTRVTGIPYVVEAGVVRNQFLVRILNKHNAPVTFHVDVLGGPPNLRWSGAEDGVAVAPLGEEIRTLVLTLPATGLKEELPIRFRVVSSSGTIVEKPATFLGPLTP